MDTVMKKPARCKKQTVLIYPGFNYDKICTWDCNAYGFRSTKTFEEIINRVPVELDGGTIEPGDLISEFSGPNTSAGFPQFRMDDGYYMKFEGLASDLSGHHLMFSRYSDKDGPIKAEWKEAGYETIYYGFKFSFDLPPGERCLFWATPAVAGRVAQTNIVRKKGDS